MSHPKRSNIEGGHERPLVVCTFLGADVLKVTSVEGVYNCIILFVCLSVLL
jgi:hypothetical protein